MDIADGVCMCGRRRHPNSAVMGRIGNGLAWVASLIVMAMTGYMMEFIVLCLMADDVYAPATIITVCVIIYGICCRVFCILLAVVTTWCTIVLYASWVMAFVYRTTDLADRATYSSSEPGSRGGCLMRLWLRCLCI